MSPSQDLRELPVALIEPNLSQPRRHFDEATLQELAGSIGERGVLQPVLVRSSEDGRYGLVAGSGVGGRLKSRACRRSRRWCPNMTISRRSRPR